MCQKKVSRAWVSNYIPQYLWVQLLNLAVDTCFWQSSVHVRFQPAVHFICDLRFPIINLGFMWVDWSTIDGWIDCWRQVMTDQQRGAVSSQLTLGKHWLSIVPRLGMRLCVHESGPIAWPNPIALCCVISELSSPAGPCLSWDLAKSQSIPPKERQTYFVVFFIV